MIDLLKLILVLCGIVLLLSRRWNLGLVLLLATVAVGLLFSYPPLDIGRDVLLATADILTLQLVLSVVLIMTLGELLRHTAGLKGIVEALQVLIPNGRIVIAALPALIGLLPMVGGAMFSAPMVDATADRLKLSAGRRTFVNYWFRHIWEPIFPLYPSMILAAALFGLTTTQLIGATWPLTAAAVTGGLLFGLLGLPRGNDDTATSSRVQALGTLATSIWPVVLVILLSFILPVDGGIGLILSLLLTIALMMAFKRIPLRDLWEVLYKRIPWKTVAVIVGALMFRRVLENSGAVVAVSKAMTDLRIPLAVVAFVVPFIPGLLTGLMAAAYSVGFPVVLPLILPDGGQIEPRWALWMMAGGVIGVMSSPIHMCLALTRVYFKAEWKAVYRYIVPSVLLVIAAAAAVLLLA